MFGRKKEQYRIYLDMLKSEVIKIKRGTEFDVFASGLSLAEFQKRVEDTAYQCGLQILSAPKEDGSGTITIRLKRI